MYKELKYKFDGRLLDETEFKFKAYKQAEKINDPIAREEYVKVITGDFKTLNMKKKWDTLYAPIGGAIFLVIILVIAFLKPFPSRFQTGTFWVILSLAASACAALIPGFLEVKYKGVVRASGAIAVYVLMYFNSPNIIASVDNKTNQRLELYVVSNDTAVAQRLVVDFDNNSGKLVSEYVAEHLGSYYGSAVAPDDYVCYRKSDGKIYSDELCRDVSEYKILLISKKVLTQFSDKRQAYIRYNKN